MNVGELKELLEEADDEAEVRIAHQPNWPLCLTVAAVRIPGDSYPEETECPYHEGYCVGHTITEAMLDPELPEFVQGEPCPEEDEEDNGRDRREYVWIVGMDHPTGDYQGRPESPYAPRWVFEG